MTSQRLKILPAAYFSYIFHTKVKLQNNGFCGQTSIDSSQNLHLEVKKDAESKNASWTWPEVYETDASTDVTYCHIVSCSQSNAEKDSKLIIDKRSVKYSFWSNSKRWLDDCWMKNPKQ